LDFSVLAALTLNEIQLNIMKLIRPVVVLIQATCSAPGRKSGTSCMLSTTEAFRLRYIRSDFDG